MNAVVLFLLLCQNSDYAPAAKAPAPPVLDRGSDDPARAGDSSSSRPAAPVASSLLLDAAAASG